MLSSVTSEINKSDGIGNGEGPTGSVKTIVPVGTAHVGCWVTLTVGGGHGITPHIFVAEVKQPVPLGVTVKLIESLEVIGVTVNVVAVIVPTFTGVPPLIL